MMSEQPSRPVETESPRYGRGFGSFVRCARTQAVRVAILIFCRRALRLVNRRLLKSFASGWRRLQVFRAYGASPPKPNMEVWRKE